MAIKSFVFAAVLVITVVQVASAQSSNYSAVQTGLFVDQLETLSHQWMDAAQHHDMPTLERLMAKEFTLVHPSQDSVTSRTEWLSGLPGLETKQFRYEHLKVVHYGPSLAVVSAVFVVDAVMNGHPFAPITSVTDVWEKRAGKWQVVTRYATLPEELKPPSSALPGNL